MGDVRRLLAADGPGQVVVERWPVLAQLAAL
jgi:hypothetical protein